MAHAGIGVELEGVHAVHAALEAGRVVSIQVETSRTRRLSALLDLARANGVSVDVVDRIDGVTEAPQGVKAVATALPTVDIDRLAEPHPAAVVVLDHVQDPHNVGAVARSALAAGMTGFVTPDRRAAPLAATAFKSGAGAFEHLRVCLHSSSADAVNRLRRVGLWIVGLTADADTSIFGLDLLTEPVAIVVGGEGAGLSRLVRERCDVLVRIPMAETVESLNVSAAATLAMFEVGRVRASG
jgi:23S rRNA (guanosine2251-2'-O)-methyltransferase